MSLSNSRAIVGRTDIGLWLLGSFLSPDLKIGVTLAIFHSEGNIPETIERLKMSVNFLCMNGAAIFNILFEIPS